MARTGVAFSGGGLRSASFCSGVLRRLLQKGSQIDYLSYVSGGGVTASSYLDWKFRHGQTDDPKWHKEFFEHMRKRIGVFVNCTNICHGFLDVVLILAMVFLLSIIFPIIFFSAFAGPTAYIIEMAFGRILRGNFICRMNGTVVLDSEATVCEADNSFATFQPIHILSLALAGSFLFFYLIEPFVGRRLSPFFHILRRVLGFTFLMVVTPWVQQQFYITTDSFWFQTVIIIGSAVVVLILPPFRGMASAVIAVYLYADITRWRVFKVPLPVLGIRYTGYYFTTLMWASVIILLVMPLIQGSQQGILHAYIRWKLQKAFYTRESIGWSGCAGLELSDFFPLRKSKQLPDMEARDRPLTLGDLEYVKPELICNVLVDNWQIERAPEEPKYELLTLTSTVVERLDREQGQRQFEGLLTPSDIMISSSMAISFAAVSLHMGNYQSRTRAFRDIQALLGLTFGHDIVVERRSVVSTIISIALQILLLFPLVFLPPFQVFQRIVPQVNTIVAIWVGTIFVLASATAFIRCGSFNASLLQKIGRWCQVYIYHVRFMRKMLSIVNIGPKPPPVLNLSDGGHYENLGILPLFKRRLERIVVVNGGFTERVDQSADDLLFALELARTRLNCSFEGIDGRDVIEDVRHNFVNKDDGKQPRCYRFRVTYYDDDSDGSKTRKVGEGEVIMLHPRHPSAGIVPETRYQSWKDFGIDLEPNLWGNGPELQEEEVDRLSGCCCSCCHCPCARCHCGGASRALCGVFPNHSTANQFLTTEMFVAYHREGYRACVEAAADDFLAIKMAGHENVGIVEIHSA